MTVVGFAIVIVVYAFFAAATVVTLWLDFKELPGRVYRRQSEANRDDPLACHLSTAESDRAVRVWKRRQLHRRVRSEER